MRFEIYSFDDRTHHFTYTTSSSKKEVIKNNLILLSILKKIINQSSKHPKKIKSKLFNPIIEMRSFKIQRGCITI